MNQPIIPLSLANETVAIVPAAALSWHQVPLPPGANSRLRAVLEGLLEDRVLDDPAQLHFALQPGAKKGTVWVAVCNRQWLTQAVDELQKSGTTVQRLAPEWSPNQAETASPATLWIVGTPEAPTAVWVNADGVQQLPLQPQQGLPALLQSVSFERVVAEPAVATVAEHLLRREVQVQSPAERWRETAANDWDLAQFDLAHRNPWLQRLQRSAGTVWSAPQWKAVRWSVLALLLVNVAGLNAFAWHAKSQLALQRQHIREVLVSTFPNVTVVVDAPLQMERELAALRQSSGNVTAKDLEFLLTGLGAADEKTLSALAPKSVEFTAGELRLQGAAVNAESLQTALQRWESAGLDSRIDGDVLVLQPRSTP